MSTNEPNPTPTNSFPGLFGCIRLPFWALFQTLKSPLALLMIAGVVVATAAVKVAEAHAEVAKAFDHNPLASSGGQFLLADVERVIEAATVRLEAAPMLIMLLFALFAGGILACVGVKRTPRPRISNLLAESGRYFFRSLRTWLLFFVSLVIWNWVFSSWIVQPLSGFIDPSRESQQFVFAIAAVAVWGLGFGLLLAVRRLSLARLVLREQRSAVLAFLGSLRLVIGRPLSMCSMAFVLTLVWAVGVSALGLWVNRLLATDQLLPALLVGIGATVYSSACNVSSFVLARRIWVLHGEVEPAREPTVVLPRAERKKAEAEVRVPV